METDFEDGDRATRPAVIAGGGVLLAFGVAMLLSTSGAIDVPLGRLIGPASLITLGMLIMLEKAGFVCGSRARAFDDARRRRRDGGLSGLWCIGLGTWMLISQMHWWGFTYATSWPLVLILSGVMMLLRGIR